MRMDDNLWFLISRKVIGLGWVVMAGEWLKNLQIYISYTSARSRYLASSQRSTAAKFHGVVFPDETNISVVTLIFNHTTNMVVRHKVQGMPELESAYITESYTYISASINFSHIPAARDHNSLPSNVTHIRTANRQNRRRSLRSRARPPQRNVLIGILTSST